MEDHNGIDEILQPWLANKTLVNVCRWIKMPHQLMLVAEVNESISGVGLASVEGTVILNYVSPEFRFQGVSKAILKHLEIYLVSCGLPVARLSATSTARQFYFDLGYVAAGEPQIGRGGKVSYPMEKLLGE